MNAPPGAPPVKHARWIALGIGAVFVAIGTPFVLMWAGIIVPDAAKLHAPLWVIGCAGLAFVLAGISVALNATSSQHRKDGSLPDNAPKPLRFVQDATALGIVGVFALVGTWVAVAPGERDFKTTGTVLGATTSSAGSSTFGRVVFGFGALLCWLLAVSLVRRLWRTYASTRRTE